MSSQHKHQHSFMRLNLHDQKTLRMFLKHLDYNYIHLIKPPLVANRLANVKCYEFFLHSHETFTMRSCPDIRCHQSPNLTAMVTMVIPANKVLKKINK